MATQARARPITADEFFRIRFPSGTRAQLVNGEIRLDGGDEIRSMAGGSLEHALIKGNIFASLRAKLKGGPCRAWDSDAAIQPNPWTVRYPDVTVDCGVLSGSDDTLGAYRLNDPRIIIEVLSPTTRAEDEEDKLAEYKAMPTVRMVVLVEPETQRLFVARRAPPPSGWSGDWHEPSTDLDLSMAGLPLVLPHAEIFARD